MRPVLLEEVVSGVDSKSKRSHPLTVHSASIWLTCELQPPYLLLAAMMES